MGYKIYIYKPNTEQWAKQNWRQRQIANKTWFLHANCYYFILSNSNDANQDNNNNNNAKTRQKLHISFCAANTTLITVAVLKLIINLINDTAWSVHDTDSAINTRTLIFITDRNLDRAGILISIRKKCFVLFFVGWCVVSVSLRITQQ